MEFLLTDECVVERSDCESGSSADCRDSSSHQPCHRQFGDRIEIHNNQDDHDYDHGYYTDQGDCSMPDCDTIRYSETSTTIPDASNGDDGAALQPYNDAASMMLGVGVPSSNISSAAGKSLHCRHHSRLASMSVVMGVLMTYTAAAWTKMDEDVDSILRLIVATVVRLSRRSISIVTSPPPAVNR